MKKNENEEVISKATAIAEWRVEYKVGYILLSALFTSIVLHYYCWSLFAMLGYSNSIVKELLICFGQIAFQYIVLHRQSIAKRMEYLVNMITVSLIGALLLLPLMIVNDFFVFKWPVMLVYFMLVVFVMLLVHLKRCKTLSLGYLPSISWVVYRILVLLFILLNSKIV